MANIKEEYLAKRRLLKKERKPRHGLSVLLEYDYLLNTDIDWIIHEIRTSIVESIKEEFDIDKRVVLTFDIDQVKTENSIELILTTGAVDPLLVQYLINIAGGLTSTLIIWGFNRLREKNLSKGNRPNIRRVTTRKLIIRGEEIEYSEREEDIFSIE
jgi:hypothetical protein